MIRSPFAYRMMRPDGDGGVADLQTDVMRFMAILALCLVAIFALVQSLQASLPATAKTETVPPPAPPVPTGLESPPDNPPQRTAATPAENKTRTRLEAEPAARPVVLRRPSPRRSIPVLATSKPEPEPESYNPPVEVSAPAAEGFSLRFESDFALTRLVASGQVGLYAINDGRARRMTVRDGTISFWDASTPKRFHEMDAATVPPVVVESLARSGADTTKTGWGVTLPDKLRRELDEILRAHRGGDRGGELIIGADGELRISGS